MTDNKYTITRTAQQTYNKRVTDTYVDTATITLKELREHLDLTEQEWHAMSPQEQNQAIEEYVTDDWCLENCVRTEDDGWATSPDEHYEQDLKIVEEA